MIVSKRWRVELEAPMVDRYYWTWLGMQISLFLRGYLYDRRRTYVGLDRNEMPIQAFVIDMREED